jgi:hypothetical protein
MHAFAGVASFVLLGLASAIFGSPNIAAAQSTPKSIEGGGTENALQARKNQWTVGVAGGQLSGIYMIFADELAQVLNDADNLRILPIVTYGPASKLDDLLYLQGVDSRSHPSRCIRVFPHPPISTRSSARHCYGNSCGGRKVSATPGRDSDRAATLP